MGWEGYGENQTRGIKLEKDVTAAQYVQHRMIFSYNTWLTKKSLYTFNLTPQDMEGQKLTHIERYKKYSEF